MMGREFATCPGNWELGSRSVSGPTRPTMSCFQQLSPAHGRHLCQMAEASVSAPASSRPQIGSRAKRRGRVVVNRFALDPWTSCLTDGVAATRAARSIGPVQCPG